MIEVPKFFPKPDPAATREFFAFLRSESQRKRFGSGALSLPSLSLEVLEGGEKIFCHWPETCAGQVCCIHNRTDHHMRAWAQHFLFDRKMMERICPHGVGHPDPDESAITDRVHGCDGCCSDALAGVDQMAELRATLLRMRDTARAANKKTPPGSLGESGGNANGG